jgi:hypothetical protein
MSVMTSGESAVKTCDRRADSSMVEGDQVTKNYNKKEVVLKTRKIVVNPCISAV